MMGSTMSSHIGFNSLHVKSDKFVGGCISWIMVILLILPLSIPPISDWFSDSKPYITSVQYPFNTTSVGFEREAKVPLNEMNTIFFKVQDYEYNTFSLKDIEPYLQFQIVKVDVTHNRDRHFETPTNYSAFKTCDETDFQKNQYERDFYKHYIVEEKENMLCIKDWVKRDIQLEGLRDFAHLNIPSTFIKLRMNVCNNDTLTEEQRKRKFRCATRTQIDEWREDKNLLPVSFENTVNFDKGDQTFVTFGKNFDYNHRTNPYLSYEQWWNSIQLKSGIFTDIGMRFKYHSYNRQNNIFQEFIRGLIFERGSEQLPHRHFYSLENWDYHVYQKPKNRLKDDSPIMDIWYRLQTQQLKHERIRTQFTKDLLAPVASVFNLVVVIQILTLGKFLKFIQIEKLLYLLYLDDADDDGHGHKKQQIQNHGHTNVKAKQQIYRKPTHQHGHDDELELSNYKKCNRYCNLCRIYLVGFSIFKSCLRCLQTRKERAFIENYKKKKAQLKSDLDLINIMRLQKHQLERQNSKSKNQIDPQNPIHDRRIEDIVMAQKSKSHNQGNSMINRKFVNPGSSIQMRDLDEEQINNRDGSMTHLNQRNNQLDQGSLRLLELQNGENARSNYRRSQLQDDQMNKSTNGSAMKSQLGDYQTNATQRPAQMLVKQDTVDIDGLFK